MDNLNENINVYISREEIFDCIKKLKNDKASGEDGIINETTEYIKSTAHQFINIYEKLFNLIFDCEIIPESWVIGKLNLFTRTRVTQVSLKIIDPLQY